MPGIISGQKRCSTFSTLESFRISSLDNRHASYQHFPPKTASHSFSASTPSPPPGPRFHPFNTAALSARLKFIMGASPHSPVSADSVGGQIHPPERTTTMKCPPHLVRAHRKGEEIWVWLCTCCYVKALLPEALRAPLKISSPV